LSTKPEVRIKARLRFQAGDEKVTYPPQIINLEWVRKLDSLESPSVQERAPEGIQHGVVHAP